MWQRLIDKSKSENSKSVYSYGVHHVNGVIIGEGPDVRWGEKHPYGWDELGQVISFLYRRLEDEGFIGRAEERKRESFVDNLREKYGSIRADTYILDEDRTAYKSILADALQKFPGAEPFLAMGDTDRAEIFVGTEKDLKKWGSKLKPGDLETLIRNKNTA
jgi:hypothetical protein